MTAKETFTQYVARIYPNDTAVVKDFDEETLIDFYPDLYEAYIDGFANAREHSLYYILMCKIIWTQCCKKMQI